MNKRRNIRDLRDQFFQGIGVPPSAPFVADDFQKNAISSLVHGNDTLIVAPTGSGKTYIALEAIEAVLLQGGKAIYTTPLKALSNTKYTEFKSRFEPNFRVGLLTGDRKIETDANLVVATTEIYRNELYRHSERYSLVVLDEVHFIADESRGAVWEESIILAPSSSTLAMLSASISNPEEIAEWLKEVRGRECNVVIKTERPVPLRYGFLHPDMGIIPLDDDHGRVIQEVKDYYGSSGLDKEKLILKDRTGGGGGFRWRDREHRDGGGHRRNNRGRGGRRR
jgi:superfamily II RNA helicase